jgi:hypothetical protein
MDEPYSTQRLLVLRKLTRTLSDYLRNQLRGYVTTLTPLLRPRVVLGDYVESSVKETVKGADKAFHDLKSIYEGIVTAKPFNLPKDLRPPLAIASSTPDISPMEYTYIARTEREKKTITMTSPLKWALTYSGFAPGRLKELLSGKMDRGGNELLQFALHSAIMHLVVSRQTGVTQILEALYYRVSTDRLKEFGDLPITYLASTLSTIRPPDDVIIESTEISGTPAFEEIVNLDDIAKMSNPFKQRLIELLKTQGEDLLPQVSERSGSSL